MDTGPITIPGSEKELSGTPTFHAKSLAGTIKISGRFYHVVYHENGGLTIIDGMGNPADPECKIWLLAEQFRPSFIACRGSDGISHRHSTSIIRIDDGTPF